MTAPVATSETVEAHTAEADHGPTLLGLDPAGWVYVGISIFFILAIFVFKAHRSVLAILDKQIAETRKSLDEAKEIRSEAEALLKDAKAKHAESAKDAKAMLDHAKVEAEHIVDKAKADTSAMIERRKKMAEQKIAAAERSAADDLRRQAANAAAAAAGKLIASKHDAEADKKLADDLISGI